MIIRGSVLCIVAFGLTACGGGGKRYDTIRAGGFGTAPVLFATGPIQQACQSDGRKAASRARCGCVQAVADQSLSASDQKRGASYFKNPAKLQEVRQSDNAGNERFWKVWKAFGQSAAAQCSES